MMRLIDADALKEQIKYTGENVSYVYMNIAMDAAIDKAPTIETKETIYIDDAEWLGGVLMNYRQLKGLTQRELADKVGVTPSTICQYEKGHRGLTRIPTLKKMADALGIKIGDFFVGYDEFEEVETERSKK